MDAIGICVCNNLVTQSVVSPSILASLSNIPSISTAVLNPVMSLSNFSGVCEDE